MPSTAPALEAVDVTRTYELEGVSVEALRGVSVAVAPGDYVAVVGPSGSGKSTLMHLLGALDRPSTGMLRVGGRDVASLSQVIGSRLDIKATIAGYGDARVSIITR